MTVGRFSCMTHVANTRRQGRWTGLACVLRPHNNPDAAHDRQDRLLESSSAAQCPAMSCDYVAPHPSSLSLEAAASHAVSQPNMGWELPPRTSADTRAPFYDFGQNQTGLQCCKQLICQYLRFSEAHDTIRMVSVTCGVSPSAEARTSDRSGPLK